MSKDRKRDVSITSSMKNNADNLESSAFHSPPEFTPTAQPVQRQSVSNKEKKTASKGSQSSNGLPDNLQQNMEAMSGMDLSDVSVHRNSSKPAQLEAEAYAQGSDIHLSPGKEQHLAHEAWHVVQQKQGRVQANTNIAGQGINDSEALESEADKMGARASSSVLQQKSNFKGGGSSLGSAPVQMWNPFKRKGKKAKKGKDDHNLVTPMKDFGGGETANEVFTGTTKGNIGDSNTKEGFIKKQLLTGGAGNETTANLGVKEDYNLETGVGTLTEDPNLIARQVVSSRLDKALGMGVIADEVFGQSMDNETIGITAKAEGKQVRENQKGEKQKFIRNHFDFKDPRIQKGLSDLQLMDALTNQQDRHMGNVFIDPATGKVTGIDNDMAFHNTKVDGGSKLYNQWEKKAAKGTSNFLPVAYQQTHVDASSAEKVLKMSEKEFIKVLSAQKGDAEKLPPGAIQNAVERFRMIKAHLQKLKDEDKLVKNWDDTTYNEMMDPKLHGFGSSNYMATAAGGYNNASTDQTSDDWKRPDPNAPQWQKGQGSNAQKGGFSIGNNRSKMQAPNYQAPMPPGPKKPNYPAPLPPGPKKPNYPAPKIPLESQLLPHRMLGSSPEMQMIGSLMNSPMLDQEYNGGGDSTKEDDDNDWD